MNDKEKKALPVRNPYLVLALRRKAGEHKKTNKALRKQENQKKSFLST